MTPNWPAIFGDEWDRVQKLGKSLHDPEEKRAFWETVREKKLANPQYRLEHDFPIGHMPVPTKALIVEPGADSERETGIRYCSAILADIASSKRELIAISERPQSDFEERLGELIDIGAHRFPMCQWPRRKGSA